MIRDLQIGDLKELDAFPRDFLLPNLNSRLVIAQRACEIDQRLAGVGLLKLTSEAMIILNPDLDTQGRAVVSKSLITQLIFDGEKGGLDDCHVFLRPENKKMAQFLKKFKFIEVEDKTMYLPPRSKYGEKSNTASSI